MKFSYPHSIQNCIGETIIFQERIAEPDGDRLIIENYVAPGVGPVMHTHFLQDEAITVIKGRLGYQLENEREQYIYEGETIVFEKGVPHRFWNDTKEVMHCKGWIKPALSIEFFLGSIFEAQNKSGKAEPEKFDGAYLVSRYKSEYELVGIPGFVRKVVIPFTYLLGKLLGKYKHFKHAPAPVRIN